MRRAMAEAALGSLRLLNGNGSLPRAAREWFDAKGVLKSGLAEDAAAALERLRQEGFPELRISQEITPWSRPEPTAFAPTPRAR